MDTILVHRHHLPMAKNWRKQAEQRRIFPPLPLKLWWKAAGVKQREVAEAIGVDEASLSQVRGGTREYMRHHLEDIAKFLSATMGRTVTPAMLLYPPTAVVLAEVASRLTTKQQQRAAKILEEAFPRNDLPDS